LKPLIKGAVLLVLKNPATKEKIVDTINTKLDIPKLTEAEEKKLLSQVYEATEESIKIVIDRI
jgi:hypothetical protein